MTLHERLKETNSLVHVSCTGAGLELQRRLWAIPGSSEYLAGFETPYSKSMMNAFLGFQPEGSYCSEGVAYDMAMASYIAASEVLVLEGIQKNPVGVGISAAVGTHRELRGGYRAHMVVITKDCIRYGYTKFNPGVGIGARCEHDNDLGNFGIREITRALDLPSYPDNPESIALERFYRHPVFHSNRLRSSGGRNYAGCMYLPAALNPIHDGHRMMCLAAESLSLGLSVRYLVSSSTPHKGSLGVQDLLYKAGMLRAERWRGEDRSVEFTRDEPLFIDKARKRRGGVFIIGVDTMERFLDPKWGLPVEPLLKEMNELGVMFLVMGRNVDGEWKTVRDVPVPGKYGGLFRELEGRVDISSTELRDKQ